MQTSQRVYKPRIKTLDSLRGIAAVFVVANHFSGGIDKYNIFGTYSPVYFLAGGYGAVIFFFLLSGYVLVYQYEANPDYTYRRFLIQRFFRIYIPYIVSFFLAVILFKLNPGNNTGSAWISKMWKEPINFSVIVDHIILINNFNTGVINPVIWSLVHEMRIALIFPIILYLVRLKPLYTLLLFLGLSVISTFFDVYNLNPSNGQFNSYNFTLFYLYVFVVGGLIAKHQNAILITYNCLKQSQKTVMLFIAIFILNYAHLSQGILKKIHFYSAIKYFANSQLETFLITLASCYIIISAIQVNNHKNFLFKKAPLFLGKISYSLYLIHMPVWAFTYFKFYGKLPLSVIVIIGLIFSFIVAIIFNKYIEQQALKWQKKLTKRAVNQS